ncbi:MAG: metallophosphoesterase [Oscillospiraceae bacterium]|nr:metallophosphoesterase [Oscillospiraceae bacterium]
MVYITGDIHGDFAKLRAAGRKLKKHDTLIVCGDFGFIWDGSKRERKILKQIGSLKYQVLFIDGVHENFDLLGAYPVTDWNGGRVQVIDGRLLHLMRGQLYTIEGKTFFTFGGGQSVDHDLRDDVKTWWEQEMPSAGEIAEATRRLEAAGNAVDYIITHQPSGRSCGHLSRGTKLDGVHIYLNVLEEKITYQQWFFGSLHIDRRLSRKHIGVFAETVKAGSEK